MHAGSFTTPRKAEIDQHRRLQKTQAENDVLTGDHQFASAAAHLISLVHMFMQRQT